MRSRRVAAVVVGVAVAAASACGSANRRAAAPTGSAAAIVADAEGRIVAAGLAGRFSIARFTAEGQLDATFAKHGIALTSFGRHYTARTRAVAVQPDGKIVAFGWADADRRCATCPAGSSVAVARYLANGRLDPTFGKGGAMLSSVGTGATTGAVAPDGSILVAGSHSEQMAERVWRDVLELHRYTSRGRGDAGFANPVEAGYFSRASVVVVEPDEKVLLVGETITASGAPHLSLGRFLRNGRIDPTFGSRGMIVNDDGDGWSTGTGMVVAADAGILAVGSITERVALVRYTRDGRADRTFGSGGLVTTGIVAATGAPTITLGPDDTIVVGHAYEVSTRRGPRWFFLLARLLADGTKDAHFGIGGQVVDRDLGPVDAIVVQSDGGIVAGVEPSPDLRRTRTADFVLTRYTRDGELDRSFGSQGTVVVRARD